MQSLGIQTVMHRNLVQRCLCACLKNVPHLVVAGFIAPHRALVRFRGGRLWAGVAFAVRISVAESLAVVAAHAAVLLPEDVTPQRYRV